MNHASVHIKLSDFSLFTDVLVKYYHKWHGNIIKNSCYFYNISFIVMQ